MTIDRTFVGAGAGRSLVQSLGADCGAGAALAAHLEAGINSVARGTSLQGVQAASVERAARDFAERGWLQADAGGWHRSPAPLPSGLGMFLAGATAMRTSLATEAAAVAVVTLPTAPSVIADALPAEGPIHASVGQTGEELCRIARSAVSSLTVMSPFFNREGVEFMIRMFDQSVARRHTLITRMAGSTRHALEPRLAEILSKGIRVLSYFLPFDDGFETFHAKVVIADGDIAYVGSANMTLYERHSMELGIIVKGRTAQAVSALVRAVERIARPVYET